MTDDVPLLWPDSRSAKDLGLQTYVSVPVTDTRNVVLGTLCGASGKKMPQGDEVMAVMELFARLIADQWKRDQALAAADERARDAEQELRDRALQLAEAEHKLKTPLTVIKGWATMLDEDRDAMPVAAQVDAITRIRVAADKLTDQVIELIERQRAVATEAPLEIGEVDLGALLKQVRDELSGMSKAHEITVDVPEPLLIQSNETTLWHILGHLGENAVKYSPNGGEVRLGARREGHRVIVSVKDQGPGLPQDVDVFQPFVRGDDETKGSGLGLHIVQTLVRSLAGELRYESVPGVGTAFFVVLSDAL